MDSHKEIAWQNRPTSKLNKNELGQLLGQCLKLASENKISAQNTWSLPLIENLPELIRDDEGCQTNFQRASVTLDAGVKIYSYRVDSVHTETFKMLGTMGRASGPQEETAEESDEDGKGGAEAPKRRRRTIELNPDATLEASLEALNVKKFDLAFTVDPLFHKTSAQFDEGGAKGLLLNNLSVYHGCEIVFDSMDVPEIAVDHAAYHPSSAEVDLSALQGALDAVGQLSGQERISPTLDEILLLLGQAPGEQAAAATDELVRRVAAESADAQPAPSASFMQTSTFSAEANTDGASLHASPSSNAARLGEYDPEEGRLAEAYDGGVGPALEDYSGSGDYDGDYGGDDNCEYGEGGGFDSYSDDEGQQSVMQQRQHDVAPFSAAKQGRRGSLGGDAIQWLISAGNSNITGKSWVGGSHWRYRAAPQSSTVAGGDVEEGEETDGGKGKKKKTTRRKNEAMDFVALLEQAEQPTFEKLSTKSPKRAKPPAKTLLPEDHHYKPEFLARYALRPRNTIRSRWASAAATHYDGDAADDDLDFGDNDFGGGGGFSDDDDNAGADIGGWGDTNFGGDAISTMNEGGTELLSAPRRVEKVEVNYSKAAKQVDVRALKETLWDGLHQVLPPEQHDDTIVSFQDVLSTVREQNSAGRLEDLSVHLCFICVLHLANEHGLEIRGTEELNRLAISNVVSV